MKGRGVMDLRTFQNPPVLFTLMPVGVIEKCLAGYLVSVTAGIGNSIILACLTMPSPLSSGK